jgi:predicted AAA+ superfamily ATPase
LLGLRGEPDLLSHPKVGASWEGYAIEETLKAVRADAAYFWATHTGAELDLLLFRRERRYGVEVKFQDAPRLTPSMRIARKDLRLNGLIVLYPGDAPYELAEGVRVIPVAHLASEDVLAIFPTRRRVVSR